MTVATRVEYDELEYRNDHLYYLDGELFSGVGYEEDQGVLVCEIHFLDGKQHGPATDYYPDGKRRGVTPYRNGLKHGVEQEWSDSGELIEENTLEFDVLMQSKKRNREGSLETVFLRSPDDPLYRKVERLRSSEARVSA